MNYVELHLGDYAEATAHLTFVEDAAYLRLLRKVYATEAALPADPKACMRLVGARSKEERDAVASVLEEFFELREDGWQQARADAEIAKFRDRQAKAKASSQLGVDARRRAGAPPNGQPVGQPKGSPDGQPNGQPTDAPNGQPVGDHRAPVPSPHTPDTSLGPKDQTPAPQPARAEPPTPPPAFDGENAEVLSAKAIVPLAIGWELPEDWGHDAVALGWQPREALHEAEKFRQWWTVGKGAGDRKSVKGWRQAWSNWLRIAAEKRR